MDQVHPSEENVTPQAPKPATGNRLQEDWLAEEQELGQDEETGSASGFGQTEG